MSSFRRFGEPRFHLASTDTTMREAAEWAERNAPEGTLITADRQTAGRGRFGRRWVSEPGAGLYFSLILRPRLAPSDVTAMTLAAGLGVARGIGETCGRQCDIRWPNDVLLNEKKVSGVLIELNAEGEVVRSAVVGVGINLNQPSMPPELADSATSLRIETGCEYVREAVLEAVLRRMEEYYEMFLERGAEAIVKAFSRASSYARGRRVTIENDGEKWRGVTAGLDARGVLLIKTADGAVRPAPPGGVRPLESEGESGEESDAVRG